MSYLLPASSTTTVFRTYNTTSGVTGAASGNLGKTFGFDFSVKEECTLQSIQLATIGTMTNTPIILLEETVDSRGTPIDIVIDITTSVGTVATFSTPVLVPNKRYVIYWITQSTLQWQCGPPMNSIFTMGSGRYDSLGGVPTAANFVTSFGYAAPWADLTFTLAQTTEYVAWPEPTIKSLPNAFTVQLPSALLPSDLKEWDLQAAKSHDNSSFGDWFDVATVDSTQLVYTHSNLDAQTTQPFYAYRYRIKDINYRESDWSEMGFAGAVATVGVTDLENGDLSVGSVDESNIADGAIFPNHITSVIGNNFVFPGSVKANATGFVFPDGSVQTTAAAGDKYAANVGAITGGTPYTVTHSMATTDIIVQFWEISTGEQVDIIPTIVDGNAFTITLPSSVSANTYRVVVMG